MEESGLNLKIRDQPIHEDEEQAKQAMDDIANTLRMVNNTFKPEITYVHKLMSSSKDFSRALGETPVPFVADAMYETPCSSHHQRAQNQDQLFHLAQAWQLSRKTRYQSLLFHPPQLLQP